MASSLLEINFHHSKTSNLITRSLPNPSFLSATRNHHSQFHFYISSKSLNRIKIEALTLSVHSSFSPPTPPSSREEAIQQAKTSLVSTLSKPLNNPKLTGKLKKVKQPRLRVEIPVVDDSPESLTQLAVEVFDTIPLRKKGSSVKTLILWPNPALTESGKKAFSNSSNLIEHKDISLVSEARILGSADVAVILAPEASQLDVMKAVTESFYPRPVVILNPGWEFQEESGFDELSGFVGSFDVVYSFTGLEVRGILSNRKGVVFKCVRDGILSGEKWNVFVEEDGQLKLVTGFSSRPSIAEVENVLYNLMAVNSPVTKSAKFLKGLVSNVTGRK